MKVYLSLLSFILALFFLSCKKATNTNNDLVFLHTSENFFITSGRIDSTQTGDIVLIGSASSVTFKVSGDHCSIQLKNRGQHSHSYISVEIDGEYKGRVKVVGNEFKTYKIDLHKEKKSQIITIYKATEAQTGDIVFRGFTAPYVFAIKTKEKKKIEFIGNSITCGMGVDYEKIPCDTDVWFDQHNAYFAYGPRVGRALDIDYMLSSSSGIGIYRNWNLDGPTMPEVYENRYLNIDSTQKWDFKRFTPDVVSICLGTNDLSDGDNIHPRSPFNAEAFTKAYIKFIDIVYFHYPNTHIALISSPMLQEEKSGILHSCLKNIQKHFYERDKPISLYLFNETFTHGCSGHPDAKDHDLIAEKLIPFYSNLLNKNPSHEERGRN